MAAAGEFHGRRRGVFVFMAAAGEILMAIDTAAPCPKNRYLRQAFLRMSAHRIGPTLIASRIQEGPLPMTQSSALQPRKHSVLDLARRPNMLIAGGAIVFASATLLGAATLLARPQAVPDPTISAPSRPAVVSVPSNAASLPASAMKDRWFEDPTPPIAVLATSAQARDDWYMDRALVRPAVAGHVVDRGYLEDPAANAPATSPHVGNRWYLDEAAVLPAPPLSMQSKDAWYLHP